VTVKGFSDGALNFLFGQTAKLESLENIAQITLAADAQFSQAEEALAKGQYQEALAAYAAAAKTAADWRKGLILCRQSQTAQKAGQSELAVKCWLDAVDAMTPGVGILALHPKGFAKAPANDAAIALLAAKLKTLKSETYALAIKQTLLELYQAQGKDSEAGALAAEMNTRPAASTPIAVSPAAPAPGPVKPPTTRSGNPASPAPAPRLTIDGESNILRDAGNLVKSSQFDRAAKIMQDNLRSLHDENLSQGLLILGEAQLGQAASAAEGSELARQAALNCMRVAAFYPTSEEAPRAMLLAGRANQKIGNTAAAQAAYQQVLARYGQNPAAKEASAALEALNKKIVPVQK
jgi:TolA-binding protein